MKTPSRETVAAVISEIYAGGVWEGERVVNHPFYQCMKDLMTMPEFMTYLGMFALATFAGDDPLTDEDITVFGVSMFVTGLKIGRAEALSMEGFL